MKKIIIPLILLLGIILFTVNSYITFGVPKTIPNFSFKTLENKEFIKNNLDNSKSKIIVHFNSECVHCQKQGILFSKELNILDTYEVVFISNEEIENIKSYKKIYNLNLENIIFLKDSRHLFLSQFGIKGYPTILTYTKEGNLIKKFEGITNIDTLIASFQKE